MNSLSMECSRCKIKATCPKSGNSPLVLFSGKKVLCSIIGGYSKIPVDKEILSNESLERCEKDGPCISIAEVPSRVDNNNIQYETVKVFHQPILHDRERIAQDLSVAFPKSHKPS